MARKQRLSVIYSENARQDVSNIWKWNALQYDADHADRYSTFLLQRIEDLARNTDTGVPVPEFAGLRRVTIKRRKQGHGHIAFYVVQDVEVRIVRVLHTAQDWPRIIDPGTS